MYKMGYFEKQDKSTESPINTRFHKFLKLTTSHKYEWESEDMTPPSFN